MANNPKETGRRLDETLDALDTWTPKDARADMAQEIVATQKPGAVKGAGGYVYQPQADGTIKILHDPTGKANNVTLSSTGPNKTAFAAVQKELGLGGGEAEVEPMTSDNTPEANTEAMLSDAGADLPTSEPLVGMLEQDKVESVDNRTPQQKYDDGDIPTPSGDIAAWIKSIVDERVAAALASGKERHTMLTKGTDR